MILNSCDSYRGQATLAEKAQRRLYVCLLDTLVFLASEQNTRVCFPDVLEHDPFRPGVMAPLVAKCWIVFCDAILVHKCSYPRVKRNINQFIAKLLGNSVPFRVEFQVSENDLLVDGQKWGSSSLSVGFSKIAALS